MNLIIRIAFFFCCSDEIIIQIENKHHVTRGEFMCLRPEEWINDGALNAHVYYLEEKGSGNWYFPTYMAVSIHILHTVIVCHLVNEFTLTVYVNVGASSKYKRWSTFRIGCQTEKGKHKSVHRRA